VGESLKEGKRRLIKRASSRSYSNSKRNNNITIGREKGRRKKAEGILDQIPAQHLKGLKRERRRNPRRRTYLRLLQLKSNLTYLTSSNLNSFQSNNLPCHRPLSKNLLLSKMLILFPKCS